MWPDLPYSISGAAVIVALVIDQIYGEPPLRWHPVVWVGNYLNAIGPLCAPRVGKAASRGGAFMLGSIAWTLGAALSLLVASACVDSIANIPPWLQVVACGALLKPLLSWRMLREEVAAVETALGRSINDGQKQIARLVSRDVSRFTEEPIRAATISTLAENLNDSVVAPIFWFLVAGLPGAALYRFANTADAMWGYRGERHGRDWTYAGKWSARADDILSWVPARLTALFIISAGARVNWSVVINSAVATPSPNGGWPMGAMASILNVRLEKPTTYVLNPAGHAPTSKDTELAIRCCSKVVWGSAVLLLMTSAANWSVRGFL